VQIIPLTNGLYPPALRALDDAPATLFARGSWPPPSRKRVAVVGTRDPSPIAHALAYQLGMELTANGCIVVSGLAYGVDAAAHNGASTTPGAYLLAVLGCGVLNIYPPEHHGQAQSILRGGALLSEVQPYANPSPSNLVARNRIITGLSDALIVVETETDGGAMHAARFASAQGRPIYTFDFPATGNQALLANGASALQTDLRELPF